MFVYITAAIVVLLIAIDCRAGIRHPEWSTCLPINNKVFGGTSGRYKIIFCKWLNRLNNASFVNGTGIFHHNIRNTSAGKRETVRTAQQRDVFSQHINQVIYRICFSDNKNAGMP